ncbi:unnamed protein product [Ixodes pacificus]
MTILPTKKASQQKSSEGDGAESSSFHGDRHSGHATEGYNFQSRTSPPPRWPTASRDEKRPAHGSSATFDEFDGVDGGPSHSKRRHRASPHRSLRKAHGHSHSMLGHRATGVVVTNFGKAGTSQGGSNSSAAEDAVSAQEDSDPSGYNSGDEYDKPPELWTAEEFKEVTLVSLCVALC